MNRVEKHKNRLQKRRLIDFMQYGFIPFKSFHYMSFSNMILTKEQAALKRVQMDKQRVV